MTLIVRPGFMFDADASTYIEAVEVADTQALETNVRYAINNFVIGCKQDGIWPAIKASCILAGARTLAGALVPLAGPTPTNVGPFVSGDYNRKTGLKGNESSKYINTKRKPSDNASQNSLHLSCYVTETSTNGTRHYIGATQTSPTSSFSQIVDNSNQLAVVVNADTGINLAGIGNSVLGFVGAQRTSSSSQEVRANRVTTAASAPSVTPNGLEFYVFGRNLDGTANGLSNRRIPFYSIGDALNLALLDARVTDLINAIGAAIP